MPPFVHLCDIPLTTFARILVFVPLSFPPSIVHTVYIIATLLGIKHRREARVGGVCVVSLQRKKLYDPESQNAALVGYTHCSNLVK